MPFYDRKGRPSAKPKGGSRVWVEGRDEIGEIVCYDMRVGRMVCAAVHFPSTGEVVYYDQNRVRPADEQSAT